MASDFFFRMDIDNPFGGSPKLVGLSVTGFGWLLGGVRRGQLTLRIDADGNWTPFDTRNSQVEVNRFKRIWTEFDYVVNGRKLWPTD